MATWLQKAATRYTITMGDGAVYTPLSMNANKSVEFNVSEFNFRNLDGTLVEKRRRMGTVYDLTMIFQGAQHLDDAQKFQQSSYDRRPWTIKHPYYGNLVVQPINAVYYDNSNDKQNTTKITVSVRQTLGYNDIVDIINPLETITSKQQVVAQSFALATINAVPLPSIADVSWMQNALKNVQNVLSKISAGLNNIINAYNQANAAINNAVNDIQSAINAIQFYVALPATIAATIANRITYLTNEFNTLQKEVANLSLPDLKSLWFAESGTVLSAICLASVSNVSNTDYQYSSQVSSVISQLITTYNSYLADLDTLQTPTGTELNSWAADPQSIIDLDNLVFLTLQTLYAYQAQALQPKYVTLTRSNNVIQIAYKLYGLLSDDSTIDKLIADNNIGCNWLLQVPKGTQILYYS